MARETLTTNPEAHFGVSPDIRLSLGLEVPPLTKKPIPTPISIPASFLQTFLKDNPKGSISKLQTSPRSRYAQLGLEVDAQGLQISDLLNSQIRLDGMVEAVAHVSNYSLRSVRLDEGSGLFKLYYDHGARLVNGDLQKAFDNEDIVISGDPGPDENWDFIRDNRSNSILGVKMRISKDRKWIPSDQQKGPIQISDMGRNFREEIKQYLNEAPKSSSQKLWIGETESEMTLRGNTHAILHVLATPGGNGKTTFADIGVHLNSRVLYPGNTHWPIILEIVSSTVDGEAPEYVNIYFAKA